LFELLRTRQRAGGYGNDLIYGRITYVRLILIQDTNVRVLAWLLPFPVPMANISQTVARLRASAVQPAANARIK